MKVLVIEATLFDGVDPDLIDDQYIEECVENLGDSLGANYDTVTYHWEDVE